MVSGFAILAAWLAGAGGLEAVLALPPMNGAAGDFAPRRAGAEAEASIRITVTNAGFHRVTQPELVAAGVDPMTLTGARMRLYAPGECAIYVSNGGLWTAADYLVFFAEKAEGDYSDANVYWLGFRDGECRRMESRQASPLGETPDIAVAPGQARYRNRAFLHEKYRPEDESLDHWFAAILNEGAAVTVKMETPQAEPAQPALLTAVVFGHSSSAKVNPDHCTRLKLNQQGVASFLYDGSGAITGTASLAGSLLKPTNTVWLKQVPLQGLPVDRAFLQELRIDYTRRLRLSNGALLFEGRTGSNTYRAEGVSAFAGLWVADVTDPLAPVLLEGWHEDGGSIRFGDRAGAPRAYAVCQETALRRVLKIELTVFQGLASPGRQADYILIGPKAFVPQMNRLAAARVADGLTVEVAALPDIYNEFGYGIEDAAAIKQFIGYAWHHWRTPRPRYVLLAGNGSFDPKGHLLEARGRKAFLARERVPVHMGPSVHGWTALDGWYAQVEGADRLADVALGRLPAESPAMLGAMIDKILTFEAVPAGSRKRREALLVADQSDRSMDGRQVCENLRTGILQPAGYRCATGYSDDIGELEVRQVVTESIHRGVSLAYYFGHGDVNRWGVEILAGKDLAAFANTTCPVTLMMACRNGAFQNPVGPRSMAEAFLQLKGHGASACIGTTALSFGPSSIAFSRGFTRSAVQEKAPRLGDAFLDGLSELNAYNPLTQELLYLNLFADPAMRINPP